MEAVFATLPPEAFLAAVAVTVFAAFVKGAVGFAMPMIMISGLGSVLPAETALAALIAPTLVANLWQALRHGVGPALAVMKTYRVYVAVVLVAIALSAQLVALLPPGVMFLAIGGPIIGFAALQLAGWAPHIPDRRRRLADLLIGSVAGLSGGLSGVWGPPTVLYLAALDTPKAESIRVQGVVYLAGSVMLAAAHLRSGVLNAETLPLSLLLLVPMVLGMWLGQRVQDRLDQRRFRRWMLVVLVVAGANLLRRGLAVLGG